MNRSLAIERQHQARLDACAVCNGSGKRRSAQRGGEQLRAGPFRIVKEHLSGHTYRAVVQEWTPDGNRVAVNHAFVPRTLGWNLAGRGECRRWIEAELAERAQREFRALSREEIDALPCGEQDAYYDALRASTA